MPVGASSPGLFHRNTLEPDAFVTLPDYHQLTQLCHKACADHFNALRKSADFKSVSALAKELLNIAQIILQNVEEKI
ncbi:MAG: hypothetical protein MHPSP_004637, partial [Paramarteilia canceri]